MPPNSDHRPKRKIAPGTWILGIIICLLLISRAVLAYFDDAWQWEGRLAEEQRLARAAGMYVTEADFVAAYEPSADALAAEALAGIMNLPAFREMSLQDMGEIRRALRRAPLDQRREILSTYTAILPMAEVLAQQNRLFRREALHPIKLRRRHHEALQLAGLVLLHRAMVNEAAGKATLADADFARVQRIAQLIASEPHPEAVGEAAELMVTCIDAIGSLGRTAPEARYPATAIARLQRLNPVLEERPSLEGAAFAFPTRFLQAQNQEGDSTDSVVEPEHARAVAARAFYETRKRWPGVTDRDRQLSTAAEFSMAFPDSEGLQPVTRFAMQSGSSDFLGIIAAKRFAKAFHAVQVAQMQGALFAARNGRVAQSAAEISDFALDPMTGRPIGYRVFEGGFIVWSAGVDGIDDGGISAKGSEAFPRRNNMPAMDLVMEFSNSRQDGDAE